MATSESQPSTATNSLKRKLSTSTSQPNSNRPIKRRASKACACCRARKVRCNVVENGVPCTNCRLDGVDCILMESRRRRRQPTQAQTTETTETANEAAVPSDTHTKDDEEEDEEKEDEESTPQKAGEVEGILEQYDIDLEGLDSSYPLHPVVSKGSTYNSDRHEPHMIYQTQGQRISHEERTRRLSMTQQTATTSPASLAAIRRIQSMAVRQLNPKPPSGPRIPRFVRALPPRWEKDDIEYLTKKGALTVPSKPLRTELLRCFVQYVYPYMPMLDLKEFLEAVIKKDGSGSKISLLLYQAVMFAGAGFVDMSHLRSAGFKSRRAARKEYFARARLLYDFDYESDRITLVQSLLLMTYWYETPDDQKDTWHWMGVSISLAHTSGLHRNPSSTRLSEDQKKLWKRIWWSLFMRDRLIALGMRRPTRIQVAECDVPMLTLEDFDTEPFPDFIVQKMGSETILRGQDQLRQLALLCIAKAKLSLCISHVLTTQYSTLGSRKGSLRDSTIMLVPRKSSSVSDEVQACDIELDRWNNELAPEARYNQWASPEECGRVLFLHRAMLRMIYLTTVSSLHRPQVLPSDPRPYLNYESAALSRAKVREAAIESTDIAQQLHCRDLIKCLPTAGVTVLLPAVIIHLLDIKSSDESIRTASLCRFYQCMQVLSRLREMYASADFAVAFLETAIKKANVSGSSSGVNGASIRRQSHGGIVIPASSSDTQSVTSYHRTATTTLTPPPENSLELAMNIDLSGLPSTDGFDTIGDTPPASSQSSSSGNEVHLASVDTTLPTFEIHDPIITVSDHTMMQSEFHDDQLLMNLDFFPTLTMPNTDVSTPINNINLRDLHRSGSTFKQESSQTPASARMASSMSSSPAAKSKALSTSTPTVAGSTPLSSASAWSPSQPLNNNLSPSDLSKSNSATNLTANAGAGGLHMDIGMDTSMHYDLSNLSGESSSFGLELDMLLDSGSNLHYDYLNHNHHDHDHEHGNKKDHQHHDGVEDFDLDDAADTKSEVDSDDGHKHTNKDNLGNNSNKHGNSFEVSTPSSTTAIDALLF